VGKTEWDAFVGDQQQEEESMTPTLTPPPETVAYPGAEERCDRCSAAAKLRVMIAGGGELVFCGHHANKYAEKLVKIAVQVAVAPEFTWRGSDLMAS
jgi:hypothetical protein